MITCLAFMLEAAIGDMAQTSKSAPDLPGLAFEVEAEARALRAQSQVSPGLYAGLEEFSADAERLATALRNAGVGHDLPTIFEGLARDARARTAALQAAAPSQRPADVAALQALLDDAIMIAPMAASVAADVTQTRDIARR